MSHFRLRSVEPGKIGGRSVAIYRRILRHHPGLWVLLLAIAAGIAPNARAGQPLSPDDAYLNALQGDWIMSGTLLGKAVKYRARGERVLDGGFLRLHMIDVAAAPLYEADVFLGYDARAGDFIAHWLDRFGAAGARVVAVGKRDGVRLVLQFPYTEAAFRDTFALDEKSGAWSLLIESQKKDGTWSTFASYTLVRPRG